MKCCFELVRVSIGYFSNLSVLRNIHYERAIQYKGECLGSIRECKESRPFPKQIPQTPPENLKNKRVHARLRINVFTLIG